MLERTKVIEHFKEMGHGERESVELANDFFTLMETPAFEQSMIDTREWLEFNYKEPDNDGRDPKENNN